MARSAAAAVRTEVHSVRGGAGNRKRKKKSVRAYVVVVMLFLTVILVFQIIGLYRKEKSLAAREAALKAQVEEQQEKSEDLKNYEAYTKSDDYTESMARSRAGLVKPNEIIFREKK